MKKIDFALQERLKKLLGSMGYELVGGELFLQGRKTVFRIYIDSQKGVTIDDCSQASRQVSAMLDVDDLFQGRYTLEVSSPGINRPLFEIAHFHKYIGKRVKIRLQAAISERRQYQGVLQRVEGDDVYLLADEMTHEIKLPFSMIEKANLIEDFL